MDDFKFVDPRNPKAIYALFSKQGFRNKNITIEIS
jgi:hypothetical protein